MYLLISVMLWLLADVIKAAIFTYQEKQRMGRVKGQRRIPTVSRPVHEFPIIYSAAWFLFQWVFPQ